MKGMPNFSGLHGRLKGKGKMGAHAGCPRICIVTPSYNQGRYLEECIVSVLDQNYPNLDYVIMDGGSTDNSVEIIKKYERYLTYWQSKPDGGQYAAIHEGFKKTTGEIMTWLNSDDFFHPKAFRRIAAIFTQRQDVVWITGRANILQENEDYFFEVPTLPLWSRKRYLEKRYKYPFIQQEGTFWCRSLWQKAGDKMRTDLLMAGDLELWVRFFRFAKLHSADVLLAAFRVHPGQKNQVFMGRYLKESERIIDNEIEFSHQERPPFLPSAPVPIIKNEIDAFVRLLEIRSKSLPLDPSALVGRTKNIPKRGMRPLISAIVSTYNAECFIRGCFEDLEAQTIADRLEIIVVDSGSEQGEGTIVKEFQKRYLNIKYIRTEQRESVYAAWNRGIKAATGTYITNANTDDRHRRDAFEVMSNILGTNPGISLVYADVIITETENESFERYSPVGYYHWMDFNRDDLLNKGCFVGPQPMWRRDVHEEYGYFDDSFMTSGDYEFWLRISQTRIFLHLSVRLGLYLKSPDSIEHSNREKQREENIKLFKLYSAAYHSGKIIRRLEPDLFSLPDVSADKRGESQMNEKIPEVQASIIISVSNQQEIIRTCIENIERHTDESHEFIFLDDGTPNGLLKWLKPSVNSKVIKTDKGAGPARSYNEGIKASNGEYIVFMHNDLVVSSEWLSGMIECINSRSGIGLVGPMTNTIDGIQKDFSADYLSVDEFDAYAGSFRERNRNRRVQSKDLSGFCIACRRDFIPNIGGFDEVFASEEVIFKDICMRSRMEGYQNVIASDVFVNHLDTHKATREGVSEIVIRDRKRFPQKWRDLGKQGQIASAFHIMRGLESANELYEEDRIQDSVNIFLDMLKQFPDEKNIYLALSKILIDAKQFKDAVEVLESMPTVEGELETPALLGYVKEGMECYEDAEGYAARAYNIDPCSALTLNLKGMLAYRRGDKQNAEEYFNKALEADPGYGEPYANLGFMQWAAGQANEAMGLIERGFILSPTITDVFANYHAVVKALEKYERAEPFFYDACRLHPKNKRLKYLLVDILLQQGKHASAMDAIEEAMVEFEMDEGALDAALEVRNKLGPDEIASSSEADTISLCMIVKNEEKHLGKCLMNMKPVVDEMIVVDTGSTDRTKDIAAIFGAKVYDFEWTNDFSAARNSSISKACGDWILVMDADEIISPLDYDALRTLVKQSASRTVGYSIVTRNYNMRTDIIGLTSNDGKYKDEEAGIGWILSDKVRLFRNGADIRFEYPVHEVVEPFMKREGIEIRKCSVPVHHYGQLNNDAWACKGEEYFRIGMQKLDDMGEDDVTAIYELAVQAGMLKKWDEAISLWQRLISLRPYVPLAYINMGTIFQKLGNYDKAIQSVKKAMEIDPDIKEAPNDYALYHLYQGNAGLAVFVLEDLVKKYPDYLSAQFKLAVAYICIGRKEDGFRFFEELGRTPMGPGLAISCHTIAEKLVSLKRIEYAEAVLEAAVEMGNVDDKIYSLLRECQNERSPGIVIKDNFPENIEAMPSV